MILEKRFLYCKTNMLITTHNLQLILGNFTSTLLIQLETNDTKSSKRFFRNGRIIFVFNF
jgi:hypothetical protein